jgi:hypothetical protein
MCECLVGHLPFNRFVTPASGAPSARMRRGFVISMLCGCLHFVVVEAG